MRKKKGTRQFLEQGKKRGLSAKPGEKKKGKGKTISLFGGGKGFVEYR